MNRRTVTVALAALALTACIKVNPNATGVEHLPAELDADTVLYTKGPAAPPVPCFASVTVTTDGGDTIAKYEEFAAAGSYTVPYVLDGEIVSEFNTQGCQPWTLEP